MRVNHPVEGTPKAPAAQQTMAPGEAELKELDRAAVEGRNSVRKQAEKATTDKERIRLGRLQQQNEEKVVKSLFELERKHRANSTGLMALALIMRLAQADGDPNSPAAKGRNQAIDILAEHYGEHEDLDLCLERLHNGSLVFRFEILCGAALKRSPHPHVRAAALLYWAMLLKESAALKTGLPSMLAELDRETGERKTLVKTWLLAIKPRVEAIDPVQANKEAARLAQRLVDEFPKVEMVGRVSDPNSFLVHRVATPQGTYASQAEHLLFELKNLSVGQAAPDFEGRDADKRTLKLSELRGKVVVLMFSANWCSPCKKTYPVLRELQRKYAGRRLEIVSIMADHEVRTVKQAQEKNEITWRALWDGPSGPIATRWNVQSYPTIYVLDSAGVIRARDIAAGSLSEQIDRLLAKSAK
jgi:peroxiredoxin